MSRQPTSGQISGKKAGGPEDGPGLSAPLDALSQKMDRLIRLMEEQVHLQRVALLEQGHILRFHAANGQRIALSLPEAQVDFLQKTILRNRNFYEAKQLAAVQEKGIVGPQSLVLDVGANIGNHSVHFAAVMGAARVIAFEPQAHCHATLQTNIALNGLESCVTTVNAMVGAQGGAGRMAGFKTRNLGGASFAPDATGEVEMVALDAVVPADDAAPLDLIKIDVEGMQLEVLRGAERLLRTRHPALWVEILPNDPAAAETRAFLEGLGYRPEKLSASDFLFRPA